MNKELNSAIITCVDQNYEENLEYDFLQTLFHKACYQGKVIILDYGMSEETVSRIEKKYDVSIKKCDKELTVFSTRYKHIPDIIRSLDESISVVMVIDGGDIWFQKSLLSIYSCVSNGIGVVAEDRIIGEDEWTEKTIQNLSVESRNKVLKILAGKKVINAGVVCGNRKLMEVVYQKVYQDILDSGIDYFGIDQLYLNYEWYQLKNDERVLLDHEYNYVVISHPLEEYEIIDDILLEKNGRMITIVHNAGGNWRIIKRPFKNRCSDEQQYYIENVKRINNGRLI